MKQRDISSFFGGSKKPAATAPVAKAGKKAAGSGGAAAANGAAPAKRTGDGDGTRQLKRLKRTGEAGNADAPAAPLDDAMLQDELEDEAAPSPAAAAAAAAGAAAGAEAAPSPAAGADSPGAKQPGSGQKASNAEASAAFKQLFGGAAAKSPAKAAAKGGSKAPTPAGRKQQTPAAAAPKAGTPKQQQQPAAAVAAAAGADGAATEQQQPQSQPQSQPYAAAGAGSDSEAEEDEGEAGTEQEADAADEQQQPSPSAAAAAAAGASPSKKPAKRKKAAAKASGAKAGGSSMEGVGTGALAAAKAAGGVDVQRLITWEAGKPVPYAFLAETFQSIAATTKRLEITSCLTGAFRAILASTPADLLPAVYLCTNRVAPAHEGTELGVGDATLIKALSAATGRKDAAIKADYEACGDLGSVAANCRSAQRTMFAPAPLTLAGVLKTFREIAKSSGPSSQERKKGLISKLLVASKGSEPGYIMRSLQGKLRIGLAEQSLLVALAHAVLLHRDSASNSDGRLADRLEGAAQAVKAAYSECPSYDVLVPALLEHPLAELAQHVHFMPGVPVRPMLAKPTTGVAEVLEKFGDGAFTCEYKYDGERVQIHVLERGRRVSIYSRNAEDMTPRYPDVTSRLPAWLADGTDSVVIDGEAVAWDPVAQRILPFQVLSTRARKEVALADVKVQVCVFAFDCLFHNGASLLHEPLTARRDALRAALRDTPGQLALATAKTSADVEELAAFLNEAVDAATEGLIVKTLADTYEPSKRSAHWLKLKKDYLAGVGDTFDVVPIGAFYGRGKRAGVFGAYLLAVYDDEAEAYQTISKLGTGFSEEQLSSLADSLRPSIIPAPRPYYQWSESLVPDVWFEPVAVWEVKAADLSVSPVHQAARGLVEEDRGISIRFPRLVRVREDKAPEQATTAAQVADMYRAQAVVRSSNAAAGGGGDDDEA